MKSPLKRSLIWPFLLIATIGNGTMQALPQTPASTATYASGAPSNTKFT